VIVDPDDIRALAPAGHYLALRVGFAFPLEEVNGLPSDWVDCYTRGRFMLFDPVIRWSYQNRGVIRWSEIDLPDPRGVLAQACRHGLRYGVSVSIHDEDEGGERSFGSFLRRDREYTLEEMERLHACVAALHAERKPPDNLTPAEIEALSMVRDGMRLKQVAHALGVSEGAIKQRLRGARDKLGATTNAQAAARARGFGLI